VANHDAFNYFLARYNITLVGDIIPSTDSIQAVRPADVTRLVNAIKQRHVCAIFTETTIDTKLARQIAGEAKVKVYDGKLYGDAIDDPGKPGGTLEGALVSNGQLMAGAFNLTC
jgi:zinc/manganese transport system substrate-binding protein